MKNILKNNIFMASFVSDMLSNFGDVVYYLALMNYVLLLPEAKFAISLVTLSESLPFLTMVFMGIWGDRTKNKVDTILGTLLLRVSLYLLVGWAMGFQPALWILLLAVAVNILSDLAGQYEDALHIPLNLRIVPAEDREAMFAFRQGTGSVLRILFQSSGAFLIGLMTYQNLAFLNAGTFAASGLIMLLLRPSLQKLLRENPIQPSEADAPKSRQENFLGKTWSSLQQSYQAVQKLPLLKSSILIIAGLNAVFSAEDALILLNIKENPNFVLINSATTLALLLMVPLAGNVLGSFLVTSLFKEAKLKKLIKISVLMPLFLFVGFFLHHVYFILLVNFITMVIVGILNPKMGALIVNSLPEDRLATITAAINSFSTLGLVFCRLLVSGLVLFLTSNQIALLFFSLSLFLLLYTMRPAAQK